MDTNAVTDAVDSLFDRCITSNDSAKAFGKAASRVRRLACHQDRAHFAHLALALEEQQRLLESLRLSHSAEARQHAVKRDQELAAFCDAQEAILNELLLF
jgi:hypothetical protein